MSSDKREDLAEYAHDAWGGWMKYLFSKGIIQNRYNSVTGTFEDELVLPAWAVERWQRQMNTPYSDLPENEKESDRKEADRMIEIMGNA